MEKDNNEKEENVRKKDKWKSKENRREKRK